MFLMSKGLLDEIYYWRTKGEPNWRRVSIEVSSEEKDYEIHFWVIVEEPKMQDWRKTKRMRKIIKLGMMVLLVIIGSSRVAVALEREVVINEIAWMGTKANPFDEWIELKNNTDRDINLTGWRLVSNDGTPDITLSGAIKAQGFYLLERSDDNTISDILANKIYTGSLSNTGEVLKLIDKEGNLVDIVNAKGSPWAAGIAKPLYSSMERVDSFKEDFLENWKTNNGKIRCGLDVKGNPMNGTPGRENSAAVEGEMQSMPPLI